MDRIPVSGILIFLALAGGMIALFAWVIPQQPDWVYVASFFAFCIVWYVINRKMND